MSLKPEYLPYVRNKDKFDLYEKIKFYSLICTLAPLRLLVAIIMFVWYFFMARTLFSLLGSRDLKVPLPDWSRRYIVNPTQVVTRVLLFVLGFHYIKIKGEPVCSGPKGDARVIVSNHLSYIDVLLIMAIADGIPCYVTKGEVTKAPIIGFTSIIWQTVYVNNRTEANKLQDPGESVTDQIRDKARDPGFPPVCIFPEGTTTNGDYVLSFRTGAFVDGQAVKPIAIRYPCQHFSPCYESMGIFQHLFRLCTQFTNYCEVEFLDVYYPSQEERMDPKLYASNVCKLIANTLDVPISPSTYKEKVEYHKLLKESKMKKD